MSSRSHVAIVTGAAQGIGLAIAKALLKEGYKVCVSDVNEEKGKQSVTSLRELYGVDHVMFLACDVSSERQLEDLFNKITQEFGKVDVLVNNAGIADECDPKSTVDVNLMGAINGCQCALKYMSKNNGGCGGTVVSVSSILGFLPYFKFPVYTATKHAIIGLTRAYGNEYYLQESGITFMAICPLYVRTAFLKSMKSRVDVKGMTSSDIPEIMDPEPVAEGVLKLLQEKQNGSTLLVLPSECVYVGYPEELKHIAIC